MASATFRPWLSRAAFLLLAALALPSFALAAGTLSIQNVVPGSTVPVGTALTFSVTGAGPSPTFYISDSYSGSSVDNTRINQSSGAVNWTPSVQDIGAHVLTITSYDASSTSATVTQAISVVPRLRVMIQSLSPGDTVNPGQVVTFTATTSGFTNPTFSVQDSFIGTGVSTLTMSAIKTLTGAFTWTPTAADAGKHSITVTASDNVGNNNYVNQLITVAGATAQTTAPLPGVTPSQLLTTTAPLPGGAGVAPAPVPAVPTPVAAVPTPAPAPAYTFTSYLKIGSTGGQVTALQNLLARDGYFSGTASGYYGAQTAAAVSKYQSAHGLDALGVVGPSTRAALNAESGGGASVPSTPAAAVTASASGNAVARHALVQQLLAQLQQMIALLTQLDSLSN